MNSYYYHTIKYNKHILPFLRFGTSGLVVVVSCVVVVDVVVVVGVVTGRFGVVFIELFIVVFVVGSGGNVGVGVGVGVVGPGVDVMGRISKP